MNVEEAVRRLNGYLQRRGAVDGSGGWTEQWLLDALTDASNEIYHKAVRFGPSIFMREDRFTYGKGLTHVTLHEMIGGRPLEIGFVGSLRSDRPDRFGIRCTPSWIGWSDQRLVHWRQVPHPGDP